MHLALVRAPAAAAEPEKKELVPAVSIRKSVTPDYIVSLEDGRKFKSLKRHLQGTYGMTPDEYRAKWGLPRDYPMVAPNYAKARSDLAKRMGLGRKSTGAPAKKARTRTQARREVSPAHGRETKNAPQCRGVLLFRQRDDQRTTTSRSSASSVISAPLKSFETGQPALAPSAAFLKSSADMPGTLPFSSSLICLDRKARAVRLDRHLGGRPQLVRHLAGPGQAEGERHVEAAGMRDREQLFRIGALLVAEAHLGRRKARSRRRRSASSDVPFRPAPIPSRPTPRCV